MQEETARIAELAERALAAIAAAHTPEELLKVRNDNFGADSWLAQYSASIKKLPADQRPALGQLVGQAREKLLAALKDQTEAVNQAQRREQFAKETVDVSAAPARRRPGARHPITMLQERMLGFFVERGWGVVEGPELECEWLNFDALNIGTYHPARAASDTIFVEPRTANQLLRTQTSPVQIRALLAGRPPLYCVSAGKVFRADSLDATHTPVFHQLEGLAVDKNISLGHLRGTVEEFARSLFGPQVKMRLRCNYFPFTEPSAEFDIYHTDAAGNRRWVEWGGCGLVNRKVLESAGADPDEYRGFAFGFGIERTLQFLYSLSDMRDIVEGDIRFSQQFSFA